MKNPENSDVCGVLVEFDAFPAEKEGFEPPEV